MTDARFQKQDIDNQGADRAFGGFPMREGVGYDGANLQRNNADALATKITQDSGNTYVAIAAPGTAQSTSKWQVQKIDSTGNIMWCDGDSAFDNVATDLTALSYS